MASETEKCLTDTIEERLARRVIQRFALKPPVDVISLIKRYANFREVSFPVNIDGLSLNIKSPNSETTVMVASDLPDTRKRFTIAHELGHILIPWHVGSIVDDINAGREGSTGRYRQKEAEANRFAAELLMPYEWVRGVLRSGVTIMGAIKLIADKARVSVDAAALRVQRIGPPDVILALSDGRKVIRAGRTPYTRANIPTVGARVSRRLVDPASEYSFTATSTGFYHAWRVQSESKLPDRPLRSSKEILEEIFRDLGYDGNRSLWASIHGIIAVANGSVREDRTREKIYSAILHNVHNRNDIKSEISSVLTHPLFGDFVVARAYEFDV